ncbi:hypothetical protein [Ruicaihuangia caeni]|uniref:hypothetical protein n=1 Tax=Ruicaihuangia caeni TaxID=3042517 RepID=UPI0033906BF8
MAATHDAPSGGIERRFPIERGQRRVVVLDSSTHAPFHAKEADARPGDEIIVNASYAGVYCAVLVNEAKPLGAIGVDCAIGKDGAGIQGLWYFEALGIPAAAADIMSVELGNGDTLWNDGVISRVNGVATQLGIEPGMTVKRAAELMLDKPAELPAPDYIARKVHFETPEGRQIVSMNSIIDALPEDTDRNVLCTAGHTGRSVIDYICDHRPYGFICSDGGFGRNESGTAALEPTAAAGIPGASVSVQTARMGDGLSTYQDGVISAANKLALELGVKIGMPAKEAARILVER